MWPKKKKRNRLISKILQTANIQCWEWHGEMSMHKSHSLWWEYKLRTDFCRTIGRIYKNWVSPFFVLALSLLGLPLWLSW